MSVKQFYYNGKGSWDDFHLYIGGQGTFNSPARDVTKIAIPGRNGELVQDNGRFLNNTVTYNVVLMETGYEIGNVYIMDYLEQVNSWLASNSKYLMLSDDYFPNEYRYARLAQGIEWEMGPYNRTAKAQIVFDCKPQRYLTLGDIDIQILAEEPSMFPYTLRNSTQFDAEPIMTLYAPSSGGEITINGKSIELTSCSTYTTINSISKECYKGSTNKNSTVILEDYKFPVLTPGNNIIDVVSGVTKVLIRPRWWTL